MINYNKMNQVVCEIWNVKMLGMFKTATLTISNLDIKFRHKFKESILVKVNCLKFQAQEKPSRMFSLPYNLPKTMSNFCPSELRRKK